MEHRINKPRVFLSHSSLDKAFVEKLHVDLRKCQIDSWLDTEEIRDGRSWLKVIFEDGIPACNAVIAYFTANSLNSDMFKKEIDAALVEQLTDKGITFLPYVEDAALRVKLRSDIRSLQCREWNVGNYHDVLPTVVSEIWHSYLERVITEATLKEKNRRLELEIELKELKSQYENSAYSLSEENEFRYIFGILNRSIEISYDLSIEGKEAKESNKLGKDVFKLSLLNTLIDYVNRGSASFSKYDWLSHITEFLEANDFLKIEQESQITYSAPRTDQNITLELQTYGFVTRTERDQTFGRIRNLVTYTYYFTDRFYRFQHWLKYNNLLNEQPPFEYLGRVD